MSEVPFTFDPDLLMHHAPGLRALVRRLVLDDSRVDDILQETWLRAMQTPPDNRAALGAWLRTVATRLAYKARHGERDRARHEGHAARSDKVPSAGDIVEREMARREVVDEVLALREPYRSTILYRFFQNLSANEIAQRQGLPVETVRTRIKRGLARLRAAMDTRHDGKPASWHVFLLPIASLPVPAVAKVAALTVSATLLFRAAAVSLLMLLGLASYLLLGSADESSSYTVAFSASDLQPLESEESGESPARAARPRTDPAPPRRLGIAPGETRLAPPHLVLEGRVVDGTKRPVAGAKVSLMLENRSWRLGARGHLVRPAVTTTANGRFRFEGPAFEETRIRVRVRHEALAPETKSYSWHAKEGELTVEDLVLGIGASARGRVVNEQGMAVTNAEVSYRSVGRAGGGWSGGWRGSSQVGSVRTDALGTFRLEHLPAGRFVLTAKSRVFLPGTSKTLTAKDAEVVACGTISVLRGARLTGLVLDTLGHPLTGARLHLLSRGRTSRPDRGLRRGYGRDRSVAVSDVRGRFELSPVPRQDVHLRVTHPSHGDEYVEVSDPLQQSWLTVRMAPRRRLEGVVLDEQSHRPIESFGITAQKLRGYVQGRTQAKKKTTSSADPRWSWLRGPAPKAELRPGGAFRIESLQPGRYLLDISAPGYVRATIGPLLIERNEPTAPLTLRLSRGRRVGGRVADAQGGAALVGAKVELFRPRDEGTARSQRRNPLGNLLESTTTGPDGIFLFGAQNPGRYNLRVSAPDRQPEIQDHLFLPPNRDLELSITLATGARVHGRVLGLRQGERAMVVFSTAPGTRASTPVDPRTGRYEIVGLQGGSYAVWVERADLASTRRLWPRSERAFDVIIEKGADLRHDLRAQDPSISIAGVKGRILSPGQDLSGLFVILRPTSDAGRGRRTRRSSSSFTRVQKDGAFEITPVPAGEYRLEVHRLVKPGSEHEPLHAEKITLPAHGPIQITVPCRSPLEKNQ